MMVLNGFLVAVYGATQDSHKPEFLAEIVHVCESESLPNVGRGDFISHADNKKRIVLSGHSLLEPIIEKSQRMKIKIVF